MLARQQSRHMAEQSLDSYTIYFCMLKWHLIDKMCTWFIQAIIMNRITLDQLSHNRSQGLTFVLFYSAFVTCSFSHILSMFLYVHVSYVCAGASVIYSTYI